MRKIRLWLAVLLTVALSAFLFAACSGKVSLNKTELTLKVGQSETLAATAPEDALLSWSSSDPAIASVSAGTVTAVAEGSATITVRATVGDAAYVAHCAVTVVAAENVTVVFVADGVTVGTVEIAYGGSVSEQDIPQVPQKDGYFGVWDKTAEELTGLTTNTTVTAQYSRALSYAVETYVQQEDLSYSKTDTKTYTGIEGGAVSVTPEAAEEGYFLDEGMSTLSATLTEETVLRVYYSLDYNRVNVSRANGTSTVYRVYHSGAMATADGERVTDFSIFALTSDAENAYYFWNVGGVIVRRALTAQDFIGTADETTIAEQASTDEVFNTKLANALFSIEDNGSVTVSEGGWTGGYLYFTGSSDALYAKFVYTMETNHSDTSIGFTLADARDMSKNVQFYLGKSDTTRFLYQNNSYGWEANESTRTLHEDGGALDAKTNQFEIALMDGYVYFWLNGEYFCSASISSLTGFGNTEGIFTDTTVFNLGMAQWRYNKPATTFTEIVFESGDAAKETASLKMPVLSLGEGTWQVDSDDESTLQLTLTSSYGNLIDLSGAEWESNNESVVRVNGNGYLTPVSKGMATIVASFVFNGKIYRAEREIEVVGVYYGLYVVEYYKQNAYTKEYELFKRETDIPAEQAEVSVSPEDVANYTLNSERSVLSAELSDGEAILQVYYDVVVEAVNVSISLSEDDTRQYTAYYGLGLYDASTKVSDYSAFAQPAGYLWKINDAYYLGTPFTEEWFSSRTSDVTAELCALEEIGQVTVNESDMKAATVNEDGSIDTVTSGWTGTYAYFNGSGTNFYAETKIRSRTQMDGGAIDKDIMGGFTVKGSDGSSFQIYMSWQYGCFRMNYGHVWTNDGAFGTTEGGSWTINGVPASANFENGTGATLGLGYVDGTFYLFIDGTLVFRFSESSLTFDGGTVAKGDAWTVGVTSWNDHKVNFSDYYAVFGAFEAPDAEPIIPTP